MSFLTKLKNLFFPAVAEKVESVAVKVAAVEATAEVKAPKVAKKPAAKKAPAKKTSPKKPNIKIAK